MTILAAWVVYALVVSGLISLGAWWAEQSLRSVGRSGRWVWVTGMMLSVLIPLWAWLRPVFYATTEVAPAAGFIPLAPIVVGPVEATPAGAISPDVWLALGWAVLTSFAVLRLVRAYLRLQSMRRSWRRTVVWGESVYVTRDLGPAVFGLRRGSILMPEWALELDGRIQHLMLLHEREHLRAGDVKLVALGHLLVLSQPWNLALLWQWRRLREAVEVDCDRRVLNRDPDARAYGALLLEVGRRRAMPQLALAFAEPRSFLERRIDLLTRARGGFRHALGLGTLAVLAVGVAVCTRDPLVLQSQPITIAMDVAPTEIWTAEPVFTPFTTPPRLANRETVERELARNYPPLLRDAGIGGEAMMWFFIDETGRARRMQINQSSGYPALDEAAARVAASMEFTPALNRARPVAVWVQIPITFSSGTQPNRERPAPTTVNAAAMTPAEMQIAEIATQDNETPRPSQNADGSSALDARLRGLSARIQPGQPRMSSTTVRNVVSRIDAFARNASARMRVPATPSAGVGAGETEFTEAPRLINNEEMGRLLDRYYPPLMKNAGVGGQVVLWSYIDENGTVARTVLQRSSNYPALDDAAIRMTESMRFSPALKGNTAVAAWVQIPVTFGER